MTILDTINAATQAVALPPTQPIYGAHYQYITAFTDGRYGEVMREAMWLAGTEFDLFPDPVGPQVTDQGRIGKGPPRTYWARYWIQLFLEVFSWLEREERKAAWGRLVEMGVVYG